MAITLSHSPAKCKDALGRALLQRIPVVIDTETTGLNWSDEIVSVGVKVGDEAFILFVRTTDISTAKVLVSMDSVRDALQPLTELGLVVVMHNAIYDMAVLGREGIQIACVVHCTRKLLMAVDQDRGRSRDTLPRWHHGLCRRLNYKLKDCVNDLLHLKAIDFPGRMASLPLGDHIHYLLSDLIVTEKLHQCLISRIRQKDFAYYHTFSATVLRQLAAMHNEGVRANVEFMRTEFEQMLGIMNKLHEQHERQFDIGLRVGDFHLKNWVYGELRQKRNGPSRTINHEYLLQLIDAVDGPTRDSLMLIHDYKLAQQMMHKFRKLLEYVQHDGHFHPLFDDSQQSGRISVTRPPLQGLPKPIGQGHDREFLTMSDVFISARDAIQARPSHLLVGFDIAQADVRSLVELVEQAKYTSSKAIREIYRSRAKRPRIKKLIAQLIGTKPIQKSESDRQEFDPTLPSNMLADLHSHDFYSTAATRVLGRPPRDKRERNRIKTMMLALINNMGINTLAIRMQCSREQAKEYVEAFRAAYPKENAFIDLLHTQIALTGESRTFAGKRRRDSLHYWLLHEKVVDIRISYKHADHLRLRIVPIRPLRHNLTCKVLRVIDVKRGSPNEGRVIYRWQQGVLTTKPYKFFNETLQYKLPFRNISWRSIREVWRLKDGKPVESNRYRGFDRVKRSLANHAFQGSTADVCKLMMLNCEQLCTKYGARIVEPIHDELLFEVPEKRATRFLRKMWAKLEEEPVPGFRTPIKVEPKIGPRFGSMEKVKPRQRHSAIWWFTGIVALMKAVKAVWKWIIK